jgi:hypothetical protein
MSTATDHQQLRVIQVNLYKLTPTALTMPVQFEVVWCSMGPISML